MSKPSENISVPNIENTRELGEWMFESSPDCVKFLDMDGRLLAMNGNGLCAMQIDDFSEFCGRQWHALWPESSHADIHTALDDAKHGQTGRFTAFCPTAKGMHKWWDVIVTPVRARDGQIQNLLSVSRDVTALRQAEDDRIGIAAQHQLALDAAELGSWHFAPAEKAFKTDQRFCSIFGLNSQEVNYDLVLFTIHPADRKRVRESIKAAACPDQRTPFIIEFRTVHPGGAIRWVAAKGQASVKNHSVSELFVQLNGTVADITERKQVEEERQNAEATLR